MKITFTGFCGAGDDAMNITFTSFLPARAPRPAIPPPRWGGYVEPRTFHGFARRRKRRRSTRGYNPPPRWGEQRQFKLSKPARPWRGAIPIGGLRRFIPRHAAGLFRPSGSMVLPCRFSANPSSAFSALKAVV